MVASRYTYRGLLQMTRDCSEACNNTQFHLVQLQAPESVTHGIIIKLQPYPCFDYNSTKVPLRYTIIASVHHKWISWLKL